MYTKVVSVQSTGAATQDITFTPNVGNPSWTPKFAIINFSRANTAADAFAEHCSQGMGFTDGTNQRCVSTASEDNQGNGDTGSIQRNDALLCALSPTGTVNAVDAIATFNSWLTNGMRINWTDAPAANFFFHVLFIGGDDIKNVKVGTLSSGTGTGTVSDTTTTWTPEFGLFLTGGVATENSGVNGAFMSVGAAISSSAQWVQSLYAQDNPANMITRQYYSHSNIVVTNDTAVTGLAALLSFNTNGFSINITDAFPASIPIYYLLVDGGKWHVGNNTEPGTATTQTNTTSKDTKGAMIFGLDTGTASTPQAGCMWSVGMGDSDVNQGVEVFEDITAGTTSIVVSRHDTNQIYLNITANATAASSVLDDEAALSAVSSTAFTLNWTNVGQARPYRYLSFGTGPVPVTKTTTLKFDVRTPTTKTTTLKFDIRNTVTKQLSLLFDIRALVTKTNTLLFDVEEIVAAATYIPVRTPHDLVNFSLIYSSGEEPVLTPVEKTVTLKFDIRTLMEKSNSLKFDVRSQAIKTNNLKFDIRTPVTKTNTLKFNILQSVTKSTSILFTILQRVTKTNNLLFSILQRMEKSNSLKFDIRSPTTKTNTLKFDIRNTVEKTATLKFSIVQQVVKQLNLLFDIDQKVTRQLSILFDIRNSFEKTNTLKFDIRNQVEQLETLRFDIRQQVTKDTSLLFDVISRMTKTTSLKFDIRQMVESTNTILFDVLQQITPKTVTLLFDIRDIVEKDTTIRFDIVQQAIKELSIKFDILQKVTKNTTLLFDIEQVGQVIKSLNLKFDILERREYTKTLKFDIRNEIDKLISLHFDILQQAAKTVNVKFDIRQPVTKTTNIKFDIRNEIEKLQTLKFDIRQEAINITRLKFDVRQRIEKTNTLRFHIRNQIDRALTILFSINNLVTKDTSLKFDIIGRITKLQTLRFDIEDSADLVDLIDDIIELTSEFYAAVETTRVLGRSQDETPI